MCISGFIVVFKIAGVFYPACPAVRDRRTGLPDFPAPLPNPSRSALQLGLPDWCGEIWPDLATLTADGELVE